MRAIIQTQMAIRNSGLWTAQRWFSSKRLSFEEFRKHSARFSRDEGNAYRAEYEREVKERTERKLNWNIKNRWEQRQLNDLIYNTDVRDARYRDNTKLAQTLPTGYQLQKFNSVDELYFFMDSMFTEGLDEHHLSLALDVFIRDAHMFKEEDLEKQTFKDFVRELGKALITFQDEKSYVKAAQFMDYFCIDDKLIWVNLEQYIIKKDRIFSPRSYIKLLTHFSNQVEGSQDFYDFFEFLYSSKVFDKESTEDLIQIAYSFY